MNEPSTPKIRSGLKVGNHPFFFSSAFLFVTTTTKNPWEWIIFPIERKGWIRNVAQIDIMWSCFMVHVNSSDAGAIWWIFWVILLPERCPQQKARHQKFPKSYIFLHRTKPEVHFPAGDVLSIVGDKGGTTLAHDLDWFYYLFSSLIN